MKLNGNFTIIPNEFINDLRIDVYEFRILCYLMKLSGCNSSCYPSYETIARETGMSLSKAKNGIKNLIEYGIITKENREKKSGGAASNLYVVCVKTTDEDDEVAENTTISIPDDSPSGVSEEQGGVQDDCNKYINKNINYFINNHLSSIEDVMDCAETYELKGLTKKNYESAIEIMFNSESILVGGEIIPREIVRKRLENISYEHIVYVDNNMPRKLVDGKVEIQVRNPVPYIVTALYNALRYSAEEIVKMEYGDEEIADCFRKDGADELSI